MSRPPPRDTATMLEWLDYLESLHQTAIDLGLDRIRIVADKLNLTMPFVKITVGGTNGQGSTCAMLEAILLASGYKVGTYTSPHLIDFNDRIRVHGDQAGDADNIRNFHQNEIARGKPQLNYFEDTTLAAMHTFHKQKMKV